MCVDGKCMIETPPSSSTSVPSCQKGTNCRTIFRTSVQTGSAEMGYTARQTAYQARIRGNPLILFPPEAHPALEPLRSLHDTPLRASLVVAKSPLGSIPTVLLRPSSLFNLCRSGAWICDDDASLLSFLNKLTPSLFAYAQYISWEYTYSSSHCPHT